MTGLYQSEQQAFIPIYEVYEVALALRVGCLNIGAAAYLARTKR